MGASSSSLTAMQTCLDAVCSGRSDCVGYPSDPLYLVDWVKPYNLAVNVTPMAVVKPTSADDVSAFVQCAAANSVAVQARSGGHSYANFGLGGTSGALAIDLSNLKSFSMDTTTWQATIGAGSLLGEIQSQLSDNGNRAFAHGVCPGVGIGGHATIGGLGPMSRMWGAATDHIVEVEVVTANGTLVRANSDQNADLFFAIRGAASSFGIVTEFVMRTHEAPGEAVQYTYDLQIGDAAQLAKVYSEWQAIVADPDLDYRFGTEFVLHALGAIITGTFYGSQSEWVASGIPARLPQSGNGSLVINDWLGALAHDAENEALYLSDVSSNFYAKSLAFRRDELLSDDAVRDLFQYTADADKGTLLWFVIFDATGGYLMDIPMNATAYAHRDKVLFYQSYAVDLLALSTTTTSFLDTFHARVLSHLPRNGSYGTYSGYVDLAISDPQNEYYMANLPVLQQLKAKWDPNAVFANPQSIQPAA